MTEFKVGDKVRCVDAGYSAGSLTHGREYTVTEVSKDCLFFSRGGVGWFKIRFTLVETTLSDQELADVYFKAMKEPLDSRAELIKRGYILRNLDTFVKTATIKRKETV